MKSNTIKQFTIKHYIQYQEELNHYINGTFDEDYARRIIFFTWILEIKKRKYHSLSDNSAEYNYSQKKKINHPHYKSFRKILEDKEEVVEIINRIFKPEIRIEKNNLEIYNSSYINSLFENEEADIVYKLAGTRTFFLIEHQTKVDYSMPVRILKYSTAIIEMAIKEMYNINKNTIMPNVVPIVIYTGQ